MALTLEQIDQLEAAGQLSPATAEAMRSNLAPVDTSALSPDMSSLNPANANRDSQISAALDLLRIQKENEDNQAILDQPNLQNPYLIPPANSKLNAQLDKVGQNASVPGQSDIVYPWPKEPNLEPEIETEIPPEDVAGKEDEKTRKLKTELTNKFDKLVKKGVLKPETAIKLSQVLKIPEQRISAKGNEFGSVSEKKPGAGFAGRAATMHKGIVPGTAPSQSEQTKLEDPYEKTISEIDAQEKSGKINKETANQLREETRARKRFNDALPSKARTPIPQINQGEENTFSPLKGAAESSKSKTSKAQPVVEDLTTPLDITPTIEGRRKPSLRFVEPNLYLDGGLKGYYDINDPSREFTYRDRVKYFYENRNKLAEDIFATNRSIDEALVNGDKLKQKEGEERLAALQHTQKLLEIENAKSEVNESKRQEMEKRRFYDVMESVDSLANAPDVDPKRLWNNMSTFQKVGFAISMALAGAGIGSATKGAGVSQVTNFITNLVQTDIDAQKANLVKKGKTVDARDSLYKLALQKSGNEREAEGLTRAALLENAAMNLEVKMQGLSNQQAINNGKVLAERLKIQADSEREALINNRLQEMNSQYAPVPTSGASDKGVSDIARIYRDEHLVQAGVELKEISDVDLDKLPGNTSQKINSFIMGKTGISTLSSEERKVAQAFENLEATDQQARTGAGQSDNERESAHNRHMLDPVGFVRSVRNKYNAMEASAAASNPKAHKAYKERTNIYNKPTTTDADVAKGNKK